MNTDPEIQNVVLREFWWWTRVIRGKRNIREGEKLKYYVLWENIRTIRSSKKLFSPMHASIPNCSYESSRCGSTSPLLYLNIFAEREREREEKLRVKSGWRCICIQATMFLIWNRINLKLKLSIDYVRFWIFFKVEFLNISTHTHANLGCIYIFITFMKWWRGM